MEHEGNFEIDKMNRNYQKLLKMFRVLYDKNLLQIYL